MKFITQASGEFLKTSSKSLTIVICTLLFFVAITKGYSQSNNNEEKERNMLLRIQLRLLDYGMGSIYNGGIMGIHSGARVESYLLKGKLIPELSYYKGWVDIERLSFGRKEIKPFSELKAGVRIGILKENGAVWRNLRCIDRSERSGNTITTWYENEKVYGKLHVGFAGGVYMTWAFMGKPFTKESGIEGSLLLNTQSVYGGLAITKMKDNELKNYKSGNTCRWDKYTQIYIHGIYALSYQLGSNYYYGRDEIPLDGTNTYPTTPSKRDKLRDFQPYGLVVGYEDGRMRKGFVGNYEAGIIPALKGNCFFIKAGFNIAIGI